jgi:hypothetical protein
MKWRHTNVPYLDAVLAGEYDRTSPKANGGREVSSFHP